MPALRQAIWRPPRPVRVDFPNSRSLTKFSPIVRSEGRSGHQNLRSPHCAEERHLATWWSGRRGLAESAMRSHSAAPTDLGHTSQSRGRTHPSVERGASPMVAARLPLIARKKDSSDGRSGEKPISRSGPAKSSYIRVAALRLTGNEPGRRLGLKPL